MMPSFFQNSSTSTVFVLFSLVDRFVDRTADSNNQRESIVESLRFSCTCSESLSDIESERANFFNSTAIRNYKGGDWKKYGDGRVGPANPRSNLVYLGG